MGALLTVILGAAVWVFLWGIGVKAFDAFMLFLLIVLGAGIARVVTPHLPGNRSGDS